MSYIFLQHYWWFIISLLAGILVFLLFVQGGQTLIYTLGKDRGRRDLIINSLGHKWELTFTTLVTFGGAFFASFPLFYSTSFGGAFYVWMLILLFFVIQAVAYEYRSKPANLLGEKGYEWFLILNGLMGTILLGTAVGTIFTGAEFIVNRNNFTDISNPLGVFISQWSGSMGGLEAVLDYRNVALGLAVFFLSRVVAIHYFYNNINDEEITRLSRKPLLYSSILFVLMFLIFLISLLFADGVGTSANGTLKVVDYKYIQNLMALPVVTILLLLGVVSVLWGIWLGLRSTTSKAVWFSGIGTIVTVTMLMLLAGYNGTAYYRSLTDVSNSLTIANSSSSYFTLKVMSVVSLFIPAVAAYIWYAWKSMNKKKLDTKHLSETNDKY